MTNSYSSSPSKRPKLIVLHGLNNRPEAFAPLIAKMNSLGWETSFAVLPCHGDDRSEARNFKEAFACFHRSMMELTETPYVALAFSHGALYLQLWLEKEPARRPRAQVLLAPALAINHHKKIHAIMSLLPSFFVFKSFTPRPFRRFQSLSVREYRILLEGLGAFQKIRTPFKVPSLILVDPKDELIDVKALQLLARERVRLWPRPLLKKGIGQHHLLFHPDYFPEGDWEKFTSTIDQFLLSKL